MKKRFLDTFYSKLKNEDGTDKIQSIVLPMTMINDMIHTSAKHIYEDYNLIQSEIDMLITLYFHNNGVTAKEISQRMIVTSGGISKVVKKLLTKGLILKKSSIVDKRSSLLYLTKEGKDIVEVCLPKFEKNDNKFFDILEADEKEVMQKAFKKMIYTFAE